MVSNFQMLDILIDSFSECSESKGFLSDRTKGREYVRSVHMDTGLIIEIYENIHRF